MALPRYKSGYHSWDDDDDYFDDDDNGVLHRQTAEHWRRATNLEGKYIGVELEMESQTGLSGDIIRAMPKHFTEKDGDAPHLEHDGSLDDEAGIEIIFPPLRPWMLRDPTSYFYRAVDALDNWGKVHIHRECGMHMNVNCNGWSPYKKGLFVGTIHKMPYDKLTTIGGRLTNGFCSRDSEGKTWEYYSTQPSDCHGYAVEHKSNGKRLECRFPKATTNLDEIARLTFFLEYLEDWAEHQSKVEGTPPKPTENYDLFIAWLGEHKDEAAKNLKAFLDAA